VLDLEPGVTRALKLKVIAQKGTEAGEYRVPLKVTGAGGLVESENSAFVKHTGDRSEIVLTAMEDTYSKKRTAKKNYGAAKELWVDGGDKEMKDHDHGFVYYKFRLDVPGKPLSAKVRLHVGAWDNAQSGNSGVIRLVKGEWSEKTLTYEKSPELGQELARIGKTKRGEVIERALPVSLEGREEISIALAPTSCDGGGYCSRETARPAELVVEFEALREEPKPESQAIEPLEDQDKGEKEKPTDPAPVARAVPAPPATPQEDPGPGAGALAGGIVIGLALAALCGVVALRVLRRRRKA
jgi:hypothetical protein